MDSLPAPLDFKTPGSFPYVTITQRMPVILTKAIDDVYQKTHRHEEDRASAPSDDTQSAKDCLRLMSQLKYEMQTNKPMRDITNTGSAIGYDDSGVWNAALDEARGTMGGVVKWFDAPWMLAECYMYRRIREAIETSDFLRLHDPFQEQKQSSFTTSLQPMIDMTQFLTSSIDTLAALDSGPEKDKAVEDAFIILLQFSLWGNKSDLSLLAGQGAGVLAGMQHGKSELLAAHKHKILVDHTDNVWAILCTRPPRVDIVLDNSGYELFSDLCLVLFLLDLTLTASVVLHSKACPWFVSDVTIPDFHWTLGQLIAADSPAMVRVGKACKAYFDEGRITVKSDPFWTYPHVFKHMESVAPALHADLKASSLVLFKGDLNYRKLVGDLSWPHTTPFATATCGFRPAPICALRTNKANTIAGLEDGKAEAAVQEDRDWLVNGSFAVIQGVF